GFSFPPRWRSSPGSAWRSATRRCDASCLSDPRLRQLPSHFPSPSSHSGAAGCSVLHHRRRGRGPLSRMILSGNDQSLRHEDTMAQHSPSTSTSPSTRQQPGRTAPIIEIAGLVKRYKGVAAVDGIDLEVRTGEIFGILGPNGAGKTTTLEMIEGLRTPDAGSIRVAGLDRKDGVEG